MTVGDVGEGVPIGGGDNELVKVEGPIRQRCKQRRKRAPPRVPGISPCRTVEGKEETGEVDADVELARSTGGGRCNPDL